MINQPSEGMSTNAFFERMTWLAWHLAHDVYEKYRSPDFKNAKFLQAPWEVYGPTKRNHKEEDVSIGDELIYVKFASSMRASFVIQARCPHETVDLFYIYPPMGLPAQHNIQTSLLARCTDHAMGIALLKVLEEKMHLNYVSNCLVVPSRSNYNNGRT